MNVHYYVTLFPVEALIASQLDPIQFGSYMATGSKKGSYENIIFAEIDGGFGDYFDWQYAREKCVPHQNGDPKNSLYLSVYRTLEHVPLSAIRSLYLTTRDGRTLELSRSEMTEHPPKRPYWVYQELCPIRPLAVTILDPIDFSAYMCDPQKKTFVPKIVFTDLKIFDFTSKKTGSIGPAYDKNLEHLQDCIRAVTELESKPNKIVDRSNIDRFSYQVIQYGIYIGEGAKVLKFPMKTLEELRRYHYNWGRSAMIL